MDLLLWRHADAEDLPGHLSTQRAADLKRPLTERGEKQAARVAHWLRQRLPASTLILSSPALRAIQTAQALASQPEVAVELEPDTTVSRVLARIEWPHATQTAVIVGHQPWLGRVASTLLTGSEMEWDVRKSGVWWFTHRAGQGKGAADLRAVIDADLL